MPFLAPWRRDITIFGVAQMYIVVFPSFFMQQEEGKSQEMIEILMSFQSVNSFHIQFLHIFPVLVKNNKVQRHITTPSTCRQFWRQLDFVIFKGQYLRTLNFSDWRILWLSFSHHYIFTIWKQIIGVPKISSNKVCGITSYQLCTPILFAACNKDSPDAVPDKSYDGH